MSWLAYSILSAVLLGLYDFFKKTALRDNAVVPVLFGSICAGAAVWLPFILWSAVSPQSLPSGFFDVARIGSRDHLFIFLKAILVGISWLCGYIGIKSLPLSIATPIRATAPLWTILFAVLLFHESPTSRQWTGVALIVLSFFLFTLVGRKEGIRFHQSKAVYFMMAATLTGAASALYDKFLLQTRELEPSALQAWFSVYLLVVIVPAMLLWLRSGKRQPFHWHWAIPVIGFTLIAADILYFIAISQPDALIALISPVRTDFGHCLVPAGDFPFQGKTRVSEGGVHCRDHSGGGPAFLTCMDWHHQGEFASISSMLELRRGGLTVAVSAGGSQLLAGGDTSGYSSVSHSPSTAPLSRSKVAV